MTYSRSLPTKVHLMLLATAFFVGPLACRGDSMPWDDGFRTQLTLQGQVNSICLQADEKLLIQGEFQWVGLTPRSGIARLNHDGSLDPAYDPGSLVPGTPIALALQPDGRSILGVRVAWNRVQLFRCNADGTLDSSFDNSPGFSVFVNEVELEILPLADGRILVGGPFAWFGSTRRLSVARLLPNGALDAAFDGSTALQYSTGIIGLAVDSTDGYLVGAYSSDINHPFFLRLRSNGELGSSSPLSTEERQRVRLAVLADGCRVAVADGTVNIYSRKGVLQKVWKNVPEQTLGRSRHRVVAQADGKLLMPGYGPDLADGRVNFGVIRVLTNGTRGTGFVMPGGISVPNGGIGQIVCQTNGGVLVTGRFTLVNGVQKLGWARLNRDGSCDRSFALGSHFTPESFTRSSRGGLLAAGTLCPEGASRCQTALLHFSATGLRDPAFQVVATFPELLVDAAAMNKDYLLLRMTIDGSAVSGAPGYFFRRASASDGTTRPDLDLFFKDSSPIIPGRVEHVVASPKDGSFYIVGSFSQVNSVPCTNVARLTPYCRLDAGFHFQRQDLLGQGVLGAQVETNGDLVLLTTRIDAGHLVRIHPDGSLAEDLNVPGPLPQMALGCYRLPDSSWVAIGMGGAMDFLRISAAGQRMALRTAACAGGAQVALNADGQFLVGGSQLTTAQGAWSGLLRLKKDALEPTRLSLGADRSLLVQGPAGQRIRLETSSDLAAWAPLTELTLTGNSEPLEIPPALSTGTSFFRTVILP